MMITDENDSSQNLEGTREDIYEIPFLFCTKCGQDLNHPLYKICEHPLFDAPLCILCYEEIKEKNDAQLNEDESEVDMEEEDEHCHWCFGDDGLTLFLCDNEGCPHQFCSHCIKENFDQDFLDQIENEPTWLCFVCNPTQLTDFKNAIRIGKDQSKLTIIHELQKIENEEEKLEHLSWLLSSVVENIEDSLKMLEESTIAEKENEIRKEILRKSPVKTISVSEQSQSELQVYCTYWRRHIDILQREEAILFELLESLGFEPRELDCYRFNILELEGKLSFSEKQARISAEKALLERDTNEQNAVDFPSNEDDTNVLTKARKPPSDLEYEEMIFEEENPGLPALEELAARHQIVNSYRAEQDLDPALFPPSFLVAQPQSVLKALFYSSTEDEIRQLAEDFHIPPHIPIIMRHADQEFPVNTTKWSIARIVHPAVCKALYYASPVELAYLSQHYQLDGSFSEFYDFGNTKEVYNLFAKEKRRRGERLLLPEKAFHEASAEEEKKIKVHSEYYETRDGKFRKSDRKSSYFDETDQLSNEQIVNDPKITIRERKKRKFQDILTFETKDDSVDQFELTEERDAELVPFQRKRWSSAKRKSLRASNNFENLRSQFVEQKRKLKESEFPGHDEKFEIKSSLAFASEEHQITMESKSPENFMQQLTPSEPVPLEMSDEFYDLHSSFNLSNRLASPKLSKSSPGLVADIINQDKEDRKLPFTPAGESYVKVTSPIVVKSVESKSEQVKSKPSQPMQCIDLLDSDGENEILLTSKPKKKPNNNNTNNNRTSQAELGEHEDDIEFVGVVKKASVLKKKNVMDKLRQNSALERFFSPTTIQARKIENERRKTISTFNYYQDDENSITLNKLRPEGEKAVNVPSSVVKALKPHQIEGLQFLWTNVMGSLADAKKSTKSYHGCVLAHCMGLGKTFTIVSFLVTLLTNPLIKAIADPIARKKLEKEKRKSNEGDASFSAQMNESQFSQTDSQSVSEQTVNLCSPTPEKRSELDGNPAPVTTVKRLIFRVIIIVPKNTLQNWFDEFQKWTPDSLLAEFHLFLIESSPGKNYKINRKKKIEQWFQEGGVLIIGYEMFRNLCCFDNNTTEESIDNEEEKDGDGDRDGDENGKNKMKTNKKDAALYRKFLLKPGADLIIADEAHIIKNARSKLRNILLQVETKRRIALTGSPLQNNLTEYWVMVDWVKPFFLYSPEEFNRIFVDPIREGSNKDASEYQKLQMKKRSHVLYRKLTPIVHRKDNSELARSLQPKREFILSIKMTSFQKFLYKYYLSKLPPIARSLFRAYQCLMRIWNHPACSVMHYYQEQHKINIAMERNALIKKATDNVPVDGPEEGSEKRKKTRGRPKRDPFADILPKFSCGMEDFQKELRSSFAYYLTCSSSKTALEEMEKAAEMLEEKMLHTKHRQVIEINEENGIDLTLNDDDSFELPETRHESSESEASDADKAKNESNSLEENKKGKEKKAKKPLKRLKKLKKANNSDASDFDEDEEEDVFLEDNDENSLAEEQEEEESDDGGDDDDLDSFIVDDGDIEYEDDESASYTGSLEEFLENEEDYEDIEDDESWKSSSNQQKRKRSPTSEERRKSWKRARKESNRRKKQQIVGKSNSESYKIKKKKRMSTVDLTDIEPIRPEEIIESKLNNENDINVPDILPETSTTTPEPPEPPEPIKAASNDQLDILTEEEAPDEIESDWWKFKNELEGNDILEKVHLSPKSLLELSNKMVTLFALLALSIKNNDKMLVFSQSLYTLNVIECFLGMKNWGRLTGVVDGDVVNGCRLGEWKLNEEYLRIDGSISNRQKIIKDFNGRDQFKLMLISTKAGNMGINLQSANRVVIFDSSWNPVHDLQAIFRTYRFGQEKNVFVYRLYASGSMEEKIHKNQVVKQSLSERVVDARMPENHFTESERADLMELVDENEDPKGEADLIDENLPVEESKSNVKKRKDQKLLDTIASGTKDEVLLELIEKLGTDLFTSIEDHDSLLADKTEDHLNEDEQRAAMEEFEKEQSAGNRPSPVVLTSPPMGDVSPPPPPPQSQSQSIPSMGSFPFATPSQLDIALNTPVVARPIGLDQSAAGGLGKDSSSFNNSSSNSSGNQQPLVSNRFPSLFKDFSSITNRTNASSSSSVAYRYSNSQLPVLSYDGYPGWNLDMDILMVAFRELFPNDHELIRATSAINRYRASPKFGLEPVDIDLVKRRYHLMMNSGLYTAYLHHHFVQEILKQDQI